MIWLSTEDVAKIEKKGVRSVRIAIARRPDCFRFKYEQHGDVRRLLIHLSSLSVAGQARYWEQIRKKKAAEDLRVARENSTPMRGAAAVLPETSSAATIFSEPYYRAGIQSSPMDRGALQNREINLALQLPINFEDASRRGELDEAMRKHRLIEDALNGDWQRIRGTIQQLGTNGDRRMIAVKDLDSYFDLIAAQNDVSKGALWRWYQRARKMGLNGLIRKERTDRGKVRRIDQKAADFIRAAWLGGTQITIREVHRQLTAAGFTGISRATLTRWIQNPANINPAEAAIARNGHKFYKDHHEKVALRNYDDLSPMDIAVGDHHEFDLFVRDDAGNLYRPWLTSWIDMKSRAILGFHISDNPNAQTIAAATRHMILPKKWAKAGAFPMHGLPREIFVDNGKDYWCHQLTGQRRHLGKIDFDEQIKGLLPSLGIGMRHAIPFNARSKTVERWHGTLEEMVKLLPGYCGRNPQQRPEGLKEDLKAHEAWKKIHDLKRPKRFGTVRSTEEEKMIAKFDGESPFLAEREFIDIFEGWLVNEYHHRVSEAKGINGRTPFDVWQNDAGQVREVAGGERMLDILLQKRERRIIQQSGIAMFGAGGERRWYENDVLWSSGLVGQQVEMLYDPNDITEIIIYYKDKFLCTATTRKLLSMKIDQGITTSESDVRAAIREQRRQMREFEKSIDFAREAAEVPDAVERYVKKNRGQNARAPEDYELPIAVGAEVDVFPADAIARQEMMRTAALDNKRSTQPRVIEAVEMPHTESEEPVITRRDAWADLE